MATANSPYPRWKALIAQGIKDGMANKEKAVLYYALGTVDTGAPATLASGSSTNASGKQPHTPMPHVRMVVHRGFVNEQRSSESKTGVEPVDKAFGSNSCLMTTTDIRAPKAQQILQQIKDNGSARGEICWWMDNKQLQFRLAGTLHLLPHKDNPSAKLFDRQALSPPPSDNSDAGKSGQFDWDHERKRIFDKLSPDLLASFTRPHPSAAHPKGSELQGKPGPGEGEVDEAKNDTESPWPMSLPQPGKEENDEQRKLLAESEKNFALVVLNPDAIDVVDLSRDRRSYFTRAEGEKAGPNSEWKEERLVP